MVADDTSPHVPHNETGVAERVVEACERVLAPLIEADGGELFLVSVAPLRVVLHLSGHCNGCPGSSLTQKHVIEPALHAVAPGLAVQLTTGFVVPSGARRLRGPARNGAPA